MDNMLVVGLLVMAMIIVNPMLKASDAKKVPAASTTEATEDGSLDEDETDEDIVMLEDEETEKN
jgi:hypothetical protein